MRLSFALEKNIQTPTYLKPRSWSWLRWVEKKTRKDFFFHIYPACICLDCGCRRVIFQFLIIYLPCKSRTTLLPLPLKFLFYHIKENVQHSEVHQVHIHLSFLEEWNHNYSWVWGNQTFFSLSLKFVLHRVTLTLEWCEHVSVWFAVKGWIHLIHFSNANTIRLDLPKVICAFYDMLKSI